MFIKSLRSIILNNFSSVHKAALFCLIAVASVLTFNSVANGEYHHAKVMGLRHWSGEHTTRVVIDLDSKAEFNHRLLKEDPKLNKPGRLYVDIKGAKLGPDLTKSIQVNSTHLKNIRAGQFKSDTVRVVLDIESIDDYKIFPLFTPARIVIDVKGKGAKSAAKKTLKPAITASTDTKKTKPVASLPKPESVPKPVVVKKPSVTTRQAVQNKTFVIDTIVIDAGHGGKDPGAVGRSGLKEKDVTLKLAKLLKKDLDKKLKKTKVLLTRTRDVYVPLDERTAIAQTKEADLFISIHINASPRREASGVETYYLDLKAKDKAVIKLAARENAATQSDMSDIVSFILKDMEMNKNQEESAVLASKVQHTLSTRLKKKYSKVKSNGVKGGPFYVLVNCSMPSILVEVSFISNSREERRLKSDKYLKDVTRGISEGIVKYINNEKI